MTDYDVDSQGMPVFSAGGPSAHDSPDINPDFPAGAYDMSSDDAWTQGHEDRLTEEYEYAPEGNPFDLSRTKAPYAAPPCIDDEANDDDYDIDERNTYQARSRNDQTRVDAGTMNRRKWIKQFVNEELDERENAYWWGRHEL